MKVLLVAEGKHERGKEDRDGALETLIRRLRQDIAQCDLDRVSRNDIHIHPGKGQGYFKKALRGYSVPTQPSPEEMSDTKSKCTQLLGDSQVAMSQSEFYAKMAHAADLSTLERRCARGFAPFAKRLRAL